MDWDGTLQAFDAPVGPAESSFSLGIAFPDPVMGVELPETESSKGRRDPENMTKKRMLEMLEENFQEGIKLDPNRKIRLLTDLGLEPCQVAVWFQNRQVRWKAKQMEVLYTELRQEFDATCKEKLKLQEEALRLKVHTPISSCREEATRSWVPRRTDWREQLTYANSQLHE